MKLFNPLKHRSGQAIVEFALILPILLLLLFGVIDTSLLLYNSSMLNNATKSSLRLVSVGSSVNSVATSIQNTLEPVLGTTTFSISDGKDLTGKDCTLITFTNPSDLKAYITPPYKNTLSAGSDVLLTISYKYKFITPVNLVIGGGVPLKSTLSARLEVVPK
jgi:Flp pilus assembly protein TadG